MPSRQLILTKLSYLICYSPLFIFSLSIFFLFREEDYFICLIFLFLSHGYLAWEYYCHFNYREILIKYGNKQEKLRITKGLQPKTFQIACQQLFSKEIANYEDIQGLSLLDGSYYPVHYICQHLSFLAYNETHLLNVMSTTTTRTNNLPSFPGDPATLPAPSSTPVLFKISLAHLYGRDSASRWRQAQFAEQVRTRGLALIDMDESFAIHSTQLYQFSRSFFSLPKRQKMRYHLSQQLLEPQTLGWVWEGPHREYFEVRHAVSDNDPSPPDGESLLSVASSPPNSLTQQRTTLQKKIEQFSWPNPQFRSHAQSMERTLHNISQRVLVVLCEHAERAAQEPSFSVADSTTPSKQNSLGDQHSCPELLKQASNRIAHRCNDLIGDEDPLLASLFRIHLYHIPAALMWLFRLLPRSLLQLGWRSG